MNSWHSLAGHFVETAAGIISNLKIFEKALLGLEDSYIELFTLLALGLLAVLPVMVPARHRQIWRHLTQILGIICFVFIVYTCMGVFGMIANFFRGFYEIGRENIIALYFASVPVTILATSLLFGPFFCGWICPTGSSQEFIGLLTRRREQKRRRAGYPFSWPMLAGIILISLLFFSWLYYLSRTRIFFIEDATVYWTFILLLLLYLLVWRRPQWDQKLRRLKTLSFILIVAAAVMHVRITSPVHFGFAKVVDPASVLATVIVVIAALLVPRVWCRYLCPWRLAINWASQHSVRQIRYVPDVCTSCGICTQECEVEAVRNGRIIPRECNMCLRCVDACPEKALLLVDVWDQAACKSGVAYPAADAGNAARKAKYAK
ncbi:4Fe-4S binding protein [candidate division FCPU426 bacterium]|nr:4Fe-4S binding protein [candidate division FCPU426 bacterium]